MWDRIPCCSTGPLGKISFLGTSPKRTRREQDEMTAHTESISVRRWDSAKAPERALIIRLHAIGDVAITFPSCMAFRAKFPEACIDFLTLDTTAPLAASLEIFNTVHSFPHSTSKWERL